MTEEIDTQALGAEGDRCSLCRAPLAIDQRYCLQCGQRRGGKRPPGLSFRSGPSLALAFFPKIVE